GYNQICSSSDFKEQYYLAVSYYAYLRFYHYPYSSYKRISSSLCLRLRPRLRISLLLRRNRYRQRYTPYRQRNCCIDLRCLGCRDVSVLLGCEGVGRCVELRLQYRDLGTLGEMV
ncbi:unnamed protein product, partial [Aureobasidium pullulans]